MGIGASVATNNTEKTVDLFSSNGAVGAAIVVPFYLFLAALILSLFPRTRYYSRILAIVMVASPFVIQVFVAPILSSFGI